MKINILLQDLQAEFPHLIDKERFEVVETKEEGTWIVRKKQISYTTTSTSVPDYIVGTMDLHGASSN